MHIVINAGPGSGKTTTLVHGFNYVLSGNYGIMPTQEQSTIFHYLKQHFQGIPPSKVVFIAFNTSMKEKMQRMLPSTVKAYTFNGIGQSIIIKSDHFQKLNNNRGKELLEALIQKPLSQVPYQDRKSYNQLLKYLHCCKEELFEPNAETFSIISEKYGLPTFILTDPLQKLAIELFKAMAHPNGSIEYIDQVWRAVIRLSQKSEKPYKLAFVDEAQDMSKLRLELALSLAENVVFCGDPNQSINAFAGADDEVFKKLFQICPLQLPLQISFRHPINHINYVNNKFGTNLVAHKTTHGPIETVRAENLSEVIKTLKTGQPYTPKNPIQSLQDTPRTFELPPSSQNLTNYLLLARTNATLFKYGVRLIRNNIPAKIVRHSDAGMDIEVILIDYLKRVNSHKISIDALKNILENDLAVASKLPFRQGSFIIEVANCLLELASIATSTDQLPKMIKALTCDKEDCVNLSTIHKAKGVEAPFVFILDPPIALKAESQRDKDQELHCEFVAETRSQFYKAYVTS